jgi:hypothetical protein
MGENGTNGGKRNPATPRTHMTTDKTPRTKERNKAKPEGGHACTHDGYVCDDCCEW